MSATFVYKPISQEYAALLAPSCCAKVAYMKPIFRLGVFSEFDARKKDCCGEKCQGTIHVSDIVGCKFVFDYFLFAYVLDVTNSYPTLPIPQI